MESILAITGIWTLILGIMGILSWIAIFVIADRAGKQVRLLTDIREMLSEIGGGMERLEIKAGTHPERTQPS